MGSLINKLKQHRPFGDPVQEFAFGVKILLFGGGLVWIASTQLQLLIEKLPRPLDWLLEVVALKSLFAMRGLDQAAGEVQAALENVDLPEAQRLVSWHLVSRETSLLDESGIAAATIESLAENASDSLVAPIFYYLVGGLPTASLYRFFNTADAMLGYRTLDFEWLGKFPARIDDLFNMIPARLTAALMILAAPLLRMPSMQILGTIYNDSAKTASPNAGFPMSAMAGALGVRLEKLGHYNLGSGYPKPMAADIPRARNLLFALTGIGLVLVLLTPDKIRKRSK
jgi:adenosylcobinamide-phosphate synthase